MRTPQLGSISSGTLRTEDLLDAFKSELHYLAPEECQRIVEDFDTEGLAPDEYDDALLEEITEALESLAPDYCYFGAFPGDGADFGFWPDWDRIEEDRRTGELSSGDELPAFAPGVGALFLVVNDHGNATLYSGAQENGSAVWHELWSCV